MKNLVILGSTGSIGKNALKVIEKLEGYRVLGLSAGSNLKILKEQIYKFSPKYVSIFEEKYYKDLKKIVPSKVKILKPGIEGLCEMASLKEADIVLNSLTGAVGFLPLLTSIKSSKKIALANKEPMVMAGRQIMEEAERWSAEIIPVDSEPSAIFQCLNGIKRKEINHKVKRIFLTASGGAFYNFKGDLSKVKPQEALKHPNWKMGKKITIDSATLMNKGLEIIEIKNLFNIDLEKIEVLIHPQSIIHSAVEFCDNSVLAQMSNPDMRLPIQYAITYPERINISTIKEIDFFKLTKLEFFKPDFKRFPCLKIAIDCAKKDGFYPAVMNAANEKAVEAFLAGSISFTQIPVVIEKVLSYNFGNKNFPSLSEITEIDSWARQKAEEVISRMRVGRESRINYKGEIRDKV